MKKLLGLCLILILSACTQNSQNSGPQTQYPLAVQGDGTFGEVTYGKTLIKSFIFKNNTGSVVNTSPVITGAGFDLALSLGCGTIEPGKNCLVKVLFNSLNKEGGDYSATLSVGDQNISLSASLPVVPEPNYSFSVNGVEIEETLDLGVLSGPTLKIMTVKIRNVSPKIGNVSAISFSSPRFVVVGNTCINVKLTPGQSCGAKVYVQGSNTEELLSSSVSFDNQSKAVSIQQEVKTLNSQMLAMENSVVLGDFYEEGKNKIQLIKIENLGDGLGSIDSLDLPPGYMVGSNNCKNIKPKNSCIIRLVYNSSNLPKGIHEENVEIGDGSVNLIVNQVTNPNKLESILISSLDNVLLGVCTPVEVQVKDNEGLDFVSSSSLELVSGETLYTDSLCSVAGSSLDSFESSKTFYVTKSTAGVMNLSLSLNSIVGEKTINWYNPIQINPSASSVVIAQNLSVSAAGGIEPYTYSVVSGGGDINSGTGLFTAPNNPSTVTLRVTDSLNNFADTEISVVANLVLTAGTCSYGVPETMSCLVSGSGGVGVKNYSVDVGQINSSTGEFVGECVNNLGQSTVTVSDEYNNQAQVELNYPCVYKSCNQIKQENYGTISGLYWMDFDGKNFGLNPAQYYCEQSLNSGGWMLVSSNNASSGLIAAGVGRNNSSYHLDRIGSLGSPEPNSDYIIGSSLVSANFDQVWVLGFGGTTAANPNIGNNFPTNLGTNISATWKLNTSGVSRLTELVHRSNVTVVGSLAPNNAAYFVLDAVKSDSLNGSYSANSNQSTVGGAALQANSNEPSVGTYLGHGTTEGSFEGWYYNDTQNYNSQGYTTWVKDTYYKNPRTCAEAQSRGDLNENGYAESGVFTVDPDGFNLGVAPYQVYCDFEGNGSTLNATGGEITYDGNYKIHTFRASGNVTSNFNFTVTQGSGSINYLIVAGGGGGGGRSGGGGGAGGLLQNSTTVGIGSLGVTVGAGGAGGSGTGTVGINGADSKLGTITAKGGGGGAGDAPTTGVAGGSGGGGKYGSLGGAGTAGQGFAGGSGTSGNWAAGGGGGAGAVGVNGVNGKCGNGGAGVTSLISGLSVVYAGGGGGGSHYPDSGSLCSRGLGGAGGGGHGGIPGGANAGVNGTDHLGGGGGGGSTYSGNGGAAGRGGSGIVIIRYQYKLN